MKHCKISNIIIINPEQRKAIWTPYRYCFLSFQKYLKKLSGLTNKGQYISANNLEQKWIDKVGIHFFLFLFRKNTFLGFK